MNDNITQLYDPDDGIPILVCGCGCRLFYLICVKVASDRAKISGVECASCHAIYQIKPIEGSVPLGFKTEEDEHDHPA